MSATVGDLTPRHVGQRVTIETREAKVTGMLTGIDVDTDWITEQSMDEEDPRRIPGRQTATVSVGSWSTTGLPLSTSVRMEGGVLP